MRCSSRFIYPCASGTHTCTHALRVCVSQTCQAEPLKRAGRPVGGWGGTGLSTEYASGSFPVLSKHWNLSYSHSWVDRCRMQKLKWEGFQNKGEVGWGVPKDVHKFLVCKWWVSMRRGRTVAPPFTNPAAAADPDELFQRQILQIAATEKTGCALAFSGKPVFRNDNRSWSRITSQYLCC